MPDVWRAAFRAVLVAGVLVGSPAQARVDNGQLLRAVGDDDLAAAKAALAGLPDPNQRGPFGATALALAVNAQDPALVALLLAHKAEPNAVSDDGVSPLGLACELGNGAVVKLLLGAGADVRRAAPDGTTDLAICAGYGPDGAVARMLELGAAADHPDSRGQTALMWAAAGGRMPAIAALVRAGADVNRVSPGGMTPLFFAIRSGKAEPLAALLAAGADAGHRAAENTSALQFAFYQHNTGAAALVAAPGAALAEYDRIGRQPLHAAAQAGDRALVRQLLRLGADPNALTGPSRITWVTEANFGVPPPPVPPAPPLLLAAAAGQAGTMRELLSAGADPAFVAADGSNVVLAAARGCNAEALALALVAAPDANVADSRGTTALHLLAGGFAFADLAAMLEVLTRNGARADLPDKRGQTAASLAGTGVTAVRAAFAAAGLIVHADP